jgi:inorganic phosphate transporter, PiT family
MSPVRVISRGRVGLFGLSQATFLALLAIFVLGIAFDYINGFHDTANAIATSVATRAIKPEYAILLSATANFVGALVALFFGTAVAGTVGSKIVDDTLIAGNGSTVLMAALLGAIAWNLITWRLSIPSSSSHALIGGLIGAAWAAAGSGAVQWETFAEKVLVPLFSSPILGVVIGFGLMVVILNVFRRANPRRMNDRFRKLQVGSAAYMAVAHGSNDAQKTMGIMTLALVTAHAISGTPKPVPVPIWVILIAATAMSLGTAAGGWRIMKTMGQKVVKLDPVHGFAAETTGASIIMVATFFGMPVSTTHVISSAIMGVGSSESVKAVRWGVARSMATAWVLTIPCSALIAASSYLLLHLVGI